MNIKVGQWVRLNKENTIVKVIAVFDDVVFDNDFNEIKKNNINKVKDTPQELVQVGDLVEHNESENDNDTFKVKNKCKDGTVILRGSVPIFIEYITAIYTPNKDKTQYTLQWKKE